VNRKIKTLAPYGVGLLAIVGVLAAPQAAQAHDQAIKVSCTSIGLSLSNYPANSTVRPIVDGVDYGTIPFGPTYSQSLALDPAVPHSYDITVISGDGDHNFDRVFIGKSDPKCLPPVEPPVTPPTPVPDVVAPQVQDYRDCDGGTFVLDNSGSNVAVTYYVNGLDFVVAAGEVARTDFDGYIVEPDAAFGGYTVTAGEKSWTFPAAADCEVVPPVVTPPTETPVPPIDEPEEPTTPVTPPVDEPTVPVEEPTTPATPVTPVTPEAPVAVVTPAPVAPTLVAALEDDAPLRIAAVDEAPATDTALAYTGTNATEAWVATLAALGAALVGLIFVLGARARQRRAQSAGGEE
jgi:hypothetical protein